MCALGLAVAGLYYITHKAKIEGVAPAPGRPVAESGR
jgi:hypothetical protein